VVSDLEAVEAGWLPLVRDHRVHVLRALDTEGMYFGQDLTTSASGFFPASFVRPVTLATPATPAPASGTKTPTAALAAYPPDPRPVLRLCSWL
jgi:hypothetical protein